MIEHTDTERLDAIANGCCVFCTIESGSIDKWYAESFMLGRFEGSTMREAIGNLLDAKNRVLN